MRRLAAIVMALVILSLATCAQADHYGWAFVIYDLQMAIEIDNSFTRTDDETLAQTNGFERYGNVKPELILEVYEPQMRSQLFVYCAQGSPYDNLDELTLAYADDLGAVTDRPDENGTTWKILTGEEFCGLPCSRILSSMQNMNAEYILMLSDDHDAYIITMITFDGQAPDSQLDGIAFNSYLSSCPPVSPDASPALPTPTSMIQGLVGAVTGR